MSHVELTTLGKSCEFFNGKAHEKSIDENGKYIVVNSKFISSDGKSFKRTNEQMFPLYKGDIVMVMSDVPNGKALAKCFIIDKDDTYSLNQRICCIRSKEFDTKYLYYQLNRHEHFLAFNNGENQTNLRKDDILACPLIKPSMEEQKRMVVELDEIYKSIEKAKQNIAKNVLNANELYERELNKIFKENQSGWPLKYLKDVCVFENGDRGKNYPNKSTRTQSGIPFINAGHILDNSIDFQSMDYISEERFNLLGNGKIKPNDILFCLRGSLGKVASVGNLDKGAIASSLVIVRPKNQLLATYLIKYFNSSVTTTFIKEFGNGAAQPNLSAGNLKLFQIPLPSENEQLQVVAFLNELEEHSKYLKDKYLQKLDNLEELKSGVLKRAFENELIESE